MRASKTGNMEALLASFSDDIEWVLPQIQNVPFSGKRKGRDKVAEFFASVGELQEVKSFEPREFIAQGNKVAAHGHYDWHVKSTGRDFEADFMHIFTVEGGKITRFQEYTDTAVFAAAYE